MSNFEAKVLSVVKNIPKGKTLSYKEVAERAGHPYAFRAVGAVLKKNKNPNIPCHRVIRSNGDIGNYNRGRERKIWLLSKEGSLNKSPQEKQ